MSDSIMDSLLAAGLCLLLALLIIGVYFSQAIEQEKVVMGMTTSLVVELWGEPDHKSTSEVRKEGSWFLSVTRETWTYNNPARTVVFEDGLVARIEQVER